MDPGKQQKGRQQTTAGRPFKKNHKYIPVRITDIAQIARTQPEMIGGSGTAERHADNETHDKESGKRDQSPFPFPRTHKRLLQTINGAHTV